MSKLVKFVLNMMISGGKKVAQELEETTKDPRKYQEEMLRSILESAKDSEIGKKYDFASIKSAEDFCAKLPLSDYDTYSEAIGRMVEGQEHVLTDRKIVHYNVTSGTLGVPKKIPVTETSISTFSKFNAKYLNYIAAKGVGKDWTSGKGFSLAEGTYEFLPTGVTVGCASSLHTARMQRMVPWLKMDSMDLMYTSPKDARQPPVPGTYSRYLHARFAIENPDITYGNVTFSSYLLEILRFIESNADLLVEDIEKGTINEFIEMPDEVRARVMKLLKPNPKRAAELREIFKDGFEKPVFNKVWKKLKFFICVAGAGFQTYTDKLLDRYLSHDVSILYLGLSASEGLYSVPFEINNPNAVFVPNSVFIEFIPVVNGERDLSKGTKLMHELEVGKRYELVITNVSGLYRYQMKDVIEVTGFYNNTPTMQFVNRSGYAINMYAEKTSEKALQYTAETVSKDLGLDMYDYCVNPFQDEAGGRYIFLYEFCHLPKDMTLAKLTEHTEEVLRKANTEYAAVQDDGSMKPLEVRVLQEQTFLLYRDLMIMKGKSASQLKPVHVIASPFQNKFFMGLLDEDVK